MNKDNPFLTRSPYATDEGALIGQHPKKVPLSVLSDGRPTSPTKAIRAFCIECSGGNAAEARKCTATGCALWAFRMGSSPFRGKGTPRNAGVELDGEE